MISVQPKWCRSLTLQQQSVLLLAARGPDGIAKTHPCKAIQRAYRGTVFIAARYGRELKWGEKADSFMSMDEIADLELWVRRSREFFESIDSLPHHFVLHLLHGAEILGYKHPERRQRAAWLPFYLRGCEDMHLGAETKLQMDDRLSDWNRDEW